MNGKPECIATMKMLLVETLNWRHGRALSAKGNTLKCLLISPTAFCVGVTRWSLYSCNNFWRGNCGWSIHAGTILIEDTTVHHRR